MLPQLTFTGTNNGGRSPSPDDLDTLAGIVFNAYHEKPDLWGHVLSVHATPNDAITSFRGELKWYSDHGSEFILARAHGTTLGFSQSQPGLDTLDDNLGFGVTVAGRKWRGLGIGSHLLIKALTLLPPNVRPFAQITTMDSIETRGLYRRLGGGHRRWLMLDKVRLNNPL